MITNPFSTQQIISTPEELDQKLTQFLSTPVSSQRLKLGIKSRKGLAGPTTGTLVNISYQEIIDILGKPTLRPVLYHNLGVEWEFEDKHGRGATIWNYDYNIGLSNPQERSVHWYVRGNFELLRELLSETNATVLPLYDSRGNKITGRESGNYWGCKDKFS